MLPSFESPAFVADLAIGGATLLVFHASATSVEPIVLIDGVLVLTGTGDDLLPPQGCEALSRPFPQLMKAPPP